HAPRPAGASRTPYGGGRDDTFVTTLNAGGSALVSSTYLGGDCTDFPGDLTIDGQGNTYVAGATCSTDFPTTPGVFQPAFTGFFDGFLTKLNPSASALVYSTFVGGTGGQFADGGVAVDRPGHAPV